MKRLLAALAILATIGSCTPDMRQHAVLQGEALVLDLIQRHVPPLMEYWLSRLDRYLEGSP